MSFRIACVALAVTLAGQSRAAGDGVPDMSLLIQRLDDGTELYVSADAPALFDLFATDPKTVPMRGDFIHFDAFFDGTWGIGDALLSQAAVTIDGSDAGFQAMSFMLHPKTEALPLRTRMDGMIAIGVCNTVPRGARLRLSEMQAYVGYYADRGSDASPIKIRLPRTDHAALSLQIYDIAPSGDVRAYTVSIAPDEAIILDLSPPSFVIATLRSVGIGFLGLIGAIALGFAALPRIIPRLRRFL